MKDFPKLFNDVQSEIQFSDPVEYKNWVTFRYSDIFEKGNLESVADMMLSHQIVYPQIKKMKFENQLKIVLKMTYTIVRANRVSINNILTGAAIDAFGFKHKNSKQI
ncbi:hypothetical protein [Flavicella sediminum]|uniref:hypothetical protein n=1 Tax=Flavicella sediminum TaxID=2585141 RepID=UPI00112066D7|nr:hypothetical protein [Flavicella sediminum]